MKKTIYLAVAVLLLAPAIAIAQIKETIMAEGEFKSPHDKKLRLGASFNQYWGTIKGDNLPRDYFAKPCLGMNLRAEYYIKPFIGVGVGVGLQQRGAGIITPDNYGVPFTHPWETPYDRDSTYRDRLRLQAIEVPLTLMARTPKDIIKGVRLSGAAGIVIIHQLWAKTYFLSPEDGYHLITDVSDDYIKNDLGYQISFGPEINAGGSCVLQVHFVFTKGTKNVYTFGPDGRQQTFGVRVAWLF